MIFVTSEPETPRSIPRTDSRTETIAAHIA
jgi:hypothetical protein